MNGFRLTVADLTRVGEGLRRPECVLTTASGDLYVSDQNGVALIRSDGSQQLFRARTPEGETIGANGFAMLPDGSFLIAPLTGGGVYRLQRNGEARMFLHEVEGRALMCPNYVLLDDIGRLWICALTQQDRRTMSSFRRDTRDGYIVLVDSTGARIVADNIGFPNEVKIDPSGQYLYTDETFGARLLRYPILADGALGACETVAEFDESNVFDGFTLDGEGGAWITALVSNRLWHVSRDGKINLLIEDSNPAQLARLVEMQKTTGIQKSLLYEERGSRLRNISSVAFGGPDLKTAFLGSLMGDHLLSFRSPVAGIKPAHWDFGPFAA